MKKLKNQKESIKILLKKKRHKEYIDVLFNKFFVRHKMKRIQSQFHGIGTYDVCKISLSCFDHKIYILDDALAYFYENIKSQ